MRKLGKFQLQYFNLLVSGITLKTKIELKGKRGLYEQQYQRSFYKLLDIMVEEGYVIRYDFNASGAETVRVIGSMPISKAKPIQESILPE